MLRRFTSVVIRFDCLLIHPKEIEFDFDVYVIKNEDRGGSAKSHVQRITELKPHVKIDQAREAVKIADVIIKRALEIKLAWTNITNASSRSAYTYKIAV